MKNNPQDKQEISQHAIALITFLASLPLVYFVPDFVRAVSTGYKVAKRDSSSCGYCAYYLLLCCAHSKLLFISLVHRVIC